MELMAVMKQLKFLYLPEQYESLCEQAAKQEMDYPTFLTEALTTEWQGRHVKGVESRLKQARLPGRKTLHAFDFSFQPSIDRKVIDQLATLRFVERAENLILLGPPGGGQIPSRHCLGDQSH